MDKLGCLEEESLKRKERLRNLKRKAEKNDESTEITVVKPIFRSYKSDAEKSNDSTDILSSNAIEEVVKDQLDLLKTHLVIEDVDIANLAPRKPDWDLNRDVAKKLEKLSKRTQRAIAELIRERLKNNQDNTLQVVGIETALETEKFNQK